MKTQKLSMKLAAAMTTGILLAGTEAHATNIGDVATNITDASGSLPNLISTVAYIGGIGLGVAGVFKLKQHVDNPGQVAMKDGLIRLGAGGALLALPFLTDVITGTIDAGATATGPAFSGMTFTAP